MSITALSDSFVACTPGGSYRRTKYEPDYDMYEYMEDHEAAKKIQNMFRIYFYKKIEKNKQIKFLEMYYAPGGQGYLNVYEDFKNRVVGV